MSTCITFLAPLIYLQNQDLIDEHIHQVGTAINEQTSQIREIAAQHTSRATETVRSYAGEYTQKAQEMINGARGKASAGSAGNTIRHSDFPDAPKKTSNAPGPAEPQAEAAY
jgi:hypothetical protein